MSSSPSSSQSRRDVLSNAVSVAAVGLSALLLDPNTAVAFKPGPPTAQSAANKAAESYQGVYSDPNHLEGYRVIMASSGKGGGATMTLSDGVAKDAPEGTEEKTYKNIPVAITEGSNELSFDFSFKGGPKGVVGILSNDKQSITFPDGNTWKKNANQYDGIYKDANYPNGYRIIRKFKSTKTITEVNNTGNPKDSIFIKGNHGSLFSIPTAAFAFYDYTGKETCTEKLCRSCEVVCKDELVGQFSLQESNTVFSYGTITFPDKTIWTRI
eukprot:CAMPEP_0201599658 /NCGR_PEP_ID=MMETSP0492-20130828/1026_1 /ASSEMBLY_ACC=CAM_ASM_000837 /TAXON_ID=420259 /ORGANISM="Thalassiosira gravida, Strain GMp14c1" /LENGTH=268 /DNA_ID=CAMNT_0048062277 /DNA_START=18 /DNA_END=824 /DNA_ORIENTATION=-